MNPQVDAAQAQYAQPESPLQLDRIFKFQQRLFFEMSCGLTCLCAYLGDRLALFQALAEVGPVTAAELARRKNICPAMTAQWLRVMTCAGYVERAGADDTYTLPPEHAVLLASDRGPMTIAGGLQQMGAFAVQLPAVIAAFKEHEGIAQNAYPTDLWDGMERLSATWLEHELVDNWLGALGEVRETLTNGGTLADVGCGSGRALVHLARAFPTARFVGYDASPIAVERATRRAKAAEVDGRVRFQVSDALKGIPPEFDVVTAFDSLHDMADPVDGLQSLARGLRGDGTVLVLEICVGGDLAEDSGPIGVIHHGTKLFYNLPVALAAFGEAPGALAFDEQTMKRLCREAALTLAHTIATRNPLHKLYVLKKPKF